MNRAELAAAVERRAGGRCEYCRMHQALQGATFHLEHIVPETRGGATDLENLAWTCPGCNLQKSDRVELTDPITGELVPIFHPRREIWSDHLEWHGFELLGFTPVGRRWSTVFASIMSGGNGFVTPSSFSACIRPAESDCNTI